MESQSNDMFSNSSDPMAAVRAAQDAQAAVAARVRSAWWVHVLRGFFVGATVLGVGARPDGAAWLVPVGVIGFVVLARWRTTVTGVSRANPDRWRFLALGAPWSVILLVIVAAALAFVVIDRTAPLWCAEAAAGLSAAVTMGLGPIADRSARLRMTRSFVGNTGR